jgi:hypothetical protein
MDPKPNFILENKEKELKHYEKIIVSPGYWPKKESPSQLRSDTRIRLVFAALFFKSGRTDKIVVGGGMIHEMKESFAKLMKRDLIKLGVPENLIETEEDTYDTASQVKWIKEKSDIKGNMGFITDSAQGNLVKALLPRFDLREKLDILSIENIVDDLDKKNLLIPMLKSFHNSIYWKAWWSEREILLTALAKHDPDGKIVKWVAELFRNPRKSTE